MPEVSFADFQKLDLRVGQIVEAEKLEWSEKLIKMKVDFGDLGQKQVLSGIFEWYQPEDLLEKQAVFLINLPKKYIKDEPSEAMILTSENEKENQVSIITPLGKVTNGSPIS